MLYIIFLLDDNTGWAPWMTFLGAVGMMSGHWSPPHVICSMVSHFPCGSLSVCKKGALEMYLFEAALSICSGVLLISTHVNFDVPTITVIQIHMCFTYTF